MPAPAADAPVAAPAPRPLDALALQRQRRRVQQGPQPWLHGEASRRLAERLAIVKAQPALVLDWGLHPGADQGLLRAAYPRSRIHPVALDAVPPTAPAPRPVWWKAALGLATSPAAPLAPELVAAGSAGLVWSSMALHAVATPQSLLAQWQRALAVDGFLMFTTLGPGSLAALSALYSDAGWPVPLAPLVDMHDLGDMLVAAGFADPVMDQEQLTLTWPDAAAALAELRSLGGNAALSRFAGLRGRRWQAELRLRMQERLARQGRIELGLELVYGHAFKPPPRLRLAPHTTVAVEDLRQMARQRRPTP
jgi:malonyl-CoA O-methyltransferase